MEPPAHAYLVRGFLLVARVDDARRVLADEDDVQPGRPLVFAQKACDVFANLVTNLLCKRFSIEEASAHGPGRVAKKAYDATALFRSCAVLRPRLDRGKASV